VSPKSNAAVDYAGALDTLERRAEYLSRIVHPDPGTQQRRTAHWRDEAELKSLRVAIRAVRAQRDRTNLDVLVLEALGLAANVIDEYVHPRAARAVADACEAMDATDS